MSVINEYTEVDYLDQARELVTEQFKDKTIFDKYLQLILIELATLQGVFKDLMQLRSIDTATGTQLDNIGYIIGQPRELLNVSDSPFFGFNGAVGAKTFGDSDDVSIGGRWRHSSEPESGDRYLNDSEYRRIIKAKILKNTSNCSYDDIERGLVTLFDASASSGAYLTKTDAHTLDITLGRTWSDPGLSPFPGVDEEEIARRYLPIPLGLTLTFS